MKVVTLPAVSDPSVLPPCVLALVEQLDYLPHDQLDQVLRAYAIGAKAHEGQWREGGDPYITHPVAVAEILADLGMDSQTIIAAILHDTLEDTPLSRKTLVDTFGQTVTGLVDGVTKLDKMQFGSPREANVESFRKMLLAMAQDLRVILIKLADRLHNMRTLGAKESSSRRRIARETLEIYAPIAQRLGMNKIKAELQNLGFRTLYPDRYRIISERIQKALGNHREVMSGIEAALSAQLKAQQLSSHIMGRIKSPWSIYSKMRDQYKSFSQLMDVYGFRIIADGTPSCYMALGAVHALYKPVNRHFKDFIAIPKANGYQSLHTVLLGPFGMPIEVQIRTTEMDQVAESGVAAHWIYKTNSDPANRAQTCARQWLSTLANNSAKITSSTEFMENVKIDLFPDEVYLFTPRGDILALPRHATALDFAYAVHTDVGNHAVAARIDRKLLALRTPLESGQMVEIITARSALPNPVWLEFVVTSKARTAIRHHLKCLQHEDAVDFGHRMLDRALDARDSRLEMISPAALDRFLRESHFKRLEDLLAAIALGNRMPDQVAGQLVAVSTYRSKSGESPTPPAMENIRISGTESGVLSFSNCCHPLPGDNIIGYLSSGKGTVVHRAKCSHAIDLRRFPERFIGIEWDHTVRGDYRVELRVEVANQTGIIATIAAAIAAGEANIANLAYVKHDFSRNQAASTMLFTIEVRSRKHLSDVMRRVRRLGEVNGVYRHPPL